MSETFFKSTVKSHELTTEGVSSESYDSAVSQLVSDVNQTLGSLGRTMKGLMALNKNENYEEIAKKLAKSNEQLEELSQIVAVHHLSHKL